ncbi:hypothetical protein PZB74_00600 [Porifericola rhodea]|uniref:hypothetical protein n=1 Tax=Porifericola rhodea TaxID=930972 RepID=UPI002665B041|nr:hypothetical protein [Porifericola rhodea]WKN31858.1 hypothetical protein PZB74_00600 [Porifericola rhodea]
MRWCQYISLYLLSFWTFPPLAAQELDPNKYKQWSNIDTLQWSDFQLSVFDHHIKYGLKAKAKTSLVYFYRPAIWHQDSCMNVLTAVFRKASYTRDTTDINLLLHEKLHFDIAELCARKLRKALLHLKESQANSLENYLALRDSIFTVSNEYHDLYDQETLYGLNLVRQSSWKSYIKLELNRYKDYTFKEMMNCNSSACSKQHKPY